MQGEPGFFGSFGYNSWAGLGEAKPIPTMHELGHSYWGAFPVIGRPELSWELPEGETVSPALAAYHQDVLTFMAQPPDEYELLRQRLRNLPDLSSKNTEPLLHSMEADVPYTTSGDLLLVPPILRKYWRYYLGEGPFGSWENAAGWFLALAHEERVIAGKFLGFAHLDLDAYPRLSPHSIQEAFLSDAAATLATEERQRLTDLAEQFDLLIGDPQLEENFQFWRGYLRDKVALYRSHPEHLESLSLPRADELSLALAFLAQLDGEPEGRALALAHQMDVQPFLVNFLPAVDDRTLVELFVSDPTLPDGPTLQATASFVQRLQSFGNQVERVLSEGEKRPSLGAAQLQTFLDETGLKPEHDIKLFFDLLLATDRDLAAQIVNQLDDATVRRLMIPAPTQLRAILQPSELLDKLGVIATARPEELQSGITLLVEETSGNYRIEAPFLEHLYRVIAQRAETDRSGTGDAMAGTPFPLEGFILQQPAAAAAILSGDMDMALQLVRESDPVLAPPARIIYRLIGAKPSLAATLVIALYELGEWELVQEAMAYLAYDKTRSEKYPALPISLSKDGEFLEHLLQRQGSEWLGERLTRTVRLYRQRVLSEEVSPLFLNEYRETLEAAAALAPSDGRKLAVIVDQAFE